MNNTEEYVWDSTVTYLCFVGTRSMTILEAYMFFLKHNGNSNRKGQ